MRIFARKKSTTQQQHHDGAHSGQFCGPCHDALDYYFHFLNESHSTPASWERVREVFDDRYIPFLSQPWSTGSCDLCKLLELQEGESRFQMFKEQCHGTTIGSLSFTSVWKLENVYGVFAREQHTSPVSTQLTVESWPTEWFDLAYTGPIDHSLRPHFQSQAISVNKIYASPNFVPPPLPTSTGSEQTLDTAAHWLNQCEKDHAQCRSLFAAAQSQPFRPLRLLDLRQLEHGIIHINQLSGPPTYIPYASLSYCWGGEDGFKLCPANYDDWICNGIPLDNFPSTIREAMAVARKLTTDFVWVDRVCLLQESDQWVDEAAEMEKVYGCARFNLVADASPRPSSGLWRIRDGSSVLLSGTLWKPSSAFKNPKGVDSWKQVFLSLKAGDPWKLLQHESKTASRAWVFQEELLACRRLHFGTHQIFWHCALSSNCETHPTGLHKPDAHQDLLKREFDGVRSGVAQSNRQRHEAQRKANDHSFELLWSDAVLSYTMRAMTRPTDRLRAAAGVAAELAKVDISNIYHAGLWSRNMEWYLCWRAVNDGGTQRIPQTETPSWSWGSVTGAVMMDVVHSDAFEDDRIGPGSLSLPRYDLYESLVDIHGTDVSPHRGQQGTVRDGRIQLSGYLLKVEYKMFKRTDPLPPKMLIGGDWDDTYYSPKDYACILDDNDWISCMEGTLYFLPIMYTGEVPVVRGILLQPVGREGGALPKNWVFESGRTSLQAQGIPCSAGAKFANRPRAPLETAHGGQSVRY